jgi:drug/metabolite transporter (DMT)-like permease
MVMAFLNNIIPFMLIVRGQKEIASGLASVLNATTPLFGVILAHLFTDDEKLTLQRLAGVLTGIAGVAVLVGPEALFGSSTNLIGMLLVLGAAISYGASGIWGRRFKNTPPLVTATSQLTCSTLVLLPLTLAIEQPWQLAMPSGPAIAALIALAVLSTALAYIVFFRIMAVSGPTNTLLVTLLIPVSAIAFGTLFLDEVLLPRHIAGALVIGIALVILDGRAFALLRPRPVPRA